MTTHVSSGPSLRVVLVVSHLGFGGAERQTYELLRFLRGTEWAPVRVICLSTKSNVYGDAVRQLGYPLSVVERSGGFDVRRALVLNQLLRQEDADVVHAVNWLASGYCVLARPRKTRVISSIRNSHLPAGLLRRYTLPLLVRRAAGVLVNSERGRQFVIHQCRIPPARVALVQNGIDVDHLHQKVAPGRFRRELNIPSHAPIVAYVGRKARVKNIPRLLAVARELLRQDPRLHIVIAGEGLDASVVAGTDLLGVDRLHCVGARDDIPSLLGDATVLLLTSDSEGLPNVVLEALASGVPVVSTMVGDLPRILPERCGILVPPDEEQLVAAVRRVIDDASTYRQAVDQHLAHLKATHSIQAMAAGTIDVWKAATQSLERPTWRADPVRG